MPLVSTLFAASTSTLHLTTGQHVQQTVTAAEIAHAGARLATVFELRGLQPGDRIAVWAPNGLAYLRCLAAAAAGRFVLVSINTRFSEHEAASIITRSGARLLVTDQTHKVDIDTITTDEVEGPLPDRATTAAATTDDPYIVFTTSGTTSQPKLVVHRQGSIAHHADDIPHRFGYTSQSSLLVALPLCGVFGFNSLTGAVAGNSEVWLQDKFGVDDTAALIEQHRIEAMNGTDDMFHRMLTTTHDLSSIKTAGYAAFNSSLDDIVQRCDERGAHITGLYGMSEVQALYSLRNPAEDAASRKRPGGILTSSDASARVADPETGEVLDVGVDGELQLRGPSLFAGYLAEGGDTIDAELTSANHQLDDGDQRSWFRTGDLARMEPDGTFTYLTRLGDVLRLGGFLVSPAEIEAVVMEIDGIIAAQVVAVARPNGVRPVAVIITDGRPIDEASAIAKCSTRLARFKVPVAILEVDEFPTTPSANGSKIQRVKLRELAEHTLK